MKRYPSVTINVSGWTPTSSVSLLPGKSWALTVDRAKVLRCHAVDKQQLAFIREAIIAMEHDWSGLNVSCPTDHGELTVKFDVSKYNLAEVVELVSIAADRASRAFVSIH